MKVIITIEGEMDLHGPPLAVGLEVDDGRPEEDGVELTQTQFAILSGTLEMVKERIRESVVK